MGLGDDDWFDDPVDLFDHLCKITEWLATNLSWKAILIGIPLLGLSVALLVPVMVRLWS